MAENERDRKLLFPPWLNAGSSGSAVTVLHAVLVAKYPSKCAELGLVFDDKYGPTTVELVKYVQGMLGFEGADIDGNLGPMTRRHFAMKLQFDFESLHRDAETMKTSYVDPNDERHDW